ncbi:hypothetical protein K9L63_01585 [Candidatus Gracilibacteria bacterium]|nr:hypothetical protein [Candidatus Gracilibacteria bacterium]
MRKEKRKYSDRAKYLIVAVAKRRKLLRQKAIEYKGNQCAICGYHKCSQALEFHHLDPKKRTLVYQPKATLENGKKFKKS